FTLYFTSYNFYNIASRIYGLWEDIFYGKESKENLTNILLNIIIDIRNELRKNKNYELSDKIREELRKIGIDLLDQGNKTIYRFI
ncbi:MAG: cysteine--tRNA ligase, partial [Nanoarchaeota archaeon]|nr:cysteine--tRNA ligase [Nanoarchaeota archaeon]